MSTPDPVTLGLEEDALLARARRARGIHAVAGLLIGAAAGVATTALSGLGDGLVLLTALGAVVGTLGGISTGGRRAKQFRIAAHAARRQMLLERQR